jgi:hypothetical protein
MGRWKWIAVTSAVAALGIAAPAHAGTLDQQQTTYDGSLDLGLNGPDRVAAQIFTAGLTGGLDRVDLPIGYEPGCQPSGPLIVQIRTVANGVPSATVLTSGSLASSQVDNEVGATTDFVSLAFASPAPVGAGSAYAIVLVAPAAGNCGGPLAYYEWQLSPSDTYPTGAAFFSGNGGATWPPFGNTDGAFRTYVDNDPPETSITKDVKRSETGQVKFRFTSDEAGATFECKLKGKDLKAKLRQFKNCNSPRKYKGLNEGSYKFSVRAIDASGNVDPTPAKDGFGVVG